MTWLYVICGFVMWLVDWDVVCGLGCDLWTVVQCGFVIRFVDWDVVCGLGCGCVICGL